MTSIEPGNLFSAKFSPLVSVKEGVKLCLHLARESLSAVVRGAGGDHQVSPGHGLGLLVLLVSEEECVPPRQLEPGTEDDLEPAAVKLSRGLDRDEDVFLTYPLATGDTGHCGGLESLEQDASALITECPGDIISGVKMIAGH